MRLELRGIGLIFKLALTKLKKFAPKKKQSN